MSGPETPSSAQAALLAALKARVAPEADCMAVLDFRGSAVGRLKPFNTAMAHDAALAADLCRWRAGAMTSFLTVFPPSVDATLGYLQKLMLADPARILFLIEDAEGRRVGNIGLCHVSPASAEFDNVLRGEPAPVPGFMGRVQAALAGWVRDALGCEGVHLDVIESNARAVAAYVKAGFNVTEATPLRREPLGAEAYRLVPCAPDDARVCDRLLRMEAAADTVAGGGVASAGAAGP